MSRSPLNPTQYHPRSFGDFRYVYPVLSRRSGGMSIGVNLNPTGSCTFACVYCQVLAEVPEGQSKGLLHGVPPECRPDWIDLDLLETELRDVVGLVLGERIFQPGAFPGIGDHFADTPPQQRRLNDIAFSGDGEPTLAPQFPAAVETVIRVRRECCPASVKTILITNATRLHLPNVSKSVRRIMQENGEVWAKLDAGTDELFRRISRSRVELSRVLENITQTAREFPVVVQTCVFRWDGAPSFDENQLAAYADRLIAVKDAGGRLSRVQLYTVARHTPEATVEPLDNEEIDRLAGRLRSRTGLDVEVFYSR